MYLVIKHLCNIWFANLFFSFYKLFFYFDNVLCMKAFSFDEAQSVYSFPLLLMLLV